MILIRSFLLSKSRRPRLRHPLVPLLWEDFGKIPISHLHHPINSVPSHHEWGGAHRPGRSIWILPKITSRLPLGVSVGHVPGTIDPRNERFRLIAFQNIQKILNRSSINIFLGRRKLMGSWGKSETDRKRP